jgi:hypothetical protein
MTALTAGNHTDGARVRAEKEETEGIRDEKTSNAELRIEKVFFVILNSAF